MTTRDIPALVISAEHMKARSDAFRADFVTNHLAPGKPYLVRDMLRSTSMWPANAGALRRLLERGSVQIAGDRFSNTSGEAVCALFKPVVNGSVFDVVIQVPIPLTGSVKPAATQISFILDTPLGVTFVTKPTGDGADKVPDEAVLLRVVVSDKAMTYVFGDVRPPNDPVFVLFASFLAGEKLAWELREAADKHETYRALQHVGLSKVHLLGLSSCGGGSGGGGGGGGPPNVVGQWSGLATPADTSQLPQAIAFSITSQTNDGGLEWSDPAVGPGTGTINAQGRITLFATSSALTDNLGGLLNVDFA